MERVLWIAAGGAVGSVLRYGVGRWLTTASDTDFPWGTFAVNVVGSLVLGLVMQVAVEAKALSDTMRLALGVGVLGGFTTYSTFAYETWRMTEAREWGQAALYVGASLVAGIAGIAAGTAIGRTFAS